MEFTNWIKKKITKISGVVCGPLNVSMNSALLEITKLDQEKKLQKHLELCLAH